MGDTGHEWNDKTGQRAVAFLTSFERATPGYLLSMSRVVFRYRLLDIYAHTLDVLPALEDVPAIPQTQRPSYSGRRLDKVSFVIDL
jgi:hypothetical protein